MAGGMAQQMKQVAIEVWGAELEPWIHTRKREPALKAQPPYLHACAMICMLLTLKNNKNINDFKMIKQMKNPPQTNKQTKN